MRTEAARRQAPTWEETGARRANGYARREPQATLLHQLVRVPRCSTALGRDMLPTRMSHLARSRGAKTTLLCLIGVLLVLLVRPLWHPVEQDTGAYARGYFEREDGVTRLLLGRHATGIYYPTAFVSSGGALEVPPGTSVGLRLGSAALTVSQVGVRRAPYVVVGQVPRQSLRLLAAEPRLGRDVPDGAVAALERSFTMDAQGPDGLELTPWDIDAAWVVDRDRLERLFRACRPDEANEIEIRATGHMLEVRYGHCLVREPLRIADGRAPVVSVLGGVGWATATSESGPLAEGDFEGEMLAGTAGTVVVLALLLTAAWDLVGALAFFALLALTLAIDGRLGATFALVALIATAAGLTLRMLLRANRFARDRRLWMAIVSALAAIVAAGAVAYVLTLRTPDGGPPSVSDDRIDHPTPRTSPVPTDERVQSRTDACVVLGYSTPRGIGLRSSAQNLGESLSRTCGACGGRATTLARSGGTMRWASRAYCSAYGSRGPGRGAVFWGGVNDDHLVSSEGRGVASILPLAPVLSGFVLDPPRTAADDEQLRDEAVAVAHRRASHQRRDAERLFNCMRSSTPRSVYAEDFMIQDLEAPPAQHRAAMRGVRRQAAMQAGVRVVSFLEKFAEVAGVSWFADEVHPSQIGHEFAAREVCRWLSQDEP